MPSTNFLQFNNPANNQETDAQFAVDPQVLNGAATGAVFPSELANKLFYQWSTFITAYCESLVAKGYSPEDGATSPGTAIANLQAVLANILTQADFTTFPFTPHRTTLSSNVSLSANVQATILTLSVTFPSITGATFRVDARYLAWAQVQANIINAAVIDTTNNVAYATSGRDSNGSGLEGLAASEISSRTYAAGSTASFSLVVITNGAVGGTLEVLANPGGIGSWQAISPAESTYLEITPVLASQPVLL